MLRKGMLISLLMFFFMACIPTKRQEREDSSWSELRILDDHVVAMAKALGKNPHYYRMHIRTDLDGAEIYRQVGKYVVIEPAGETIYVPDSF